MNEPHKIEDICPNCNGQGWYCGTEAGHGCDGTQESCDMNCPIPIQTQEGCEICNGTGKLLFTEVGKISPVVEIINKETIPF